MGIPIFPSTFGEQDVAIEYWEEEQGEITFIEGQGRVAGMAGAVSQAGEGSQITFTARNQHGQERRFTFMNVGGKVTLWPVRDDKMEEPLRGLDDSRVR